MSAVDAPANADLQRPFPDAAAKRAATRSSRLLRVVDAGSLEGRFWIAYDMGSAKPLADFRKRRLLPTGTCLRLLADVARALDDASAEGTFPHEVGPESVFVSDTGARLGDLGTARESFPEPSSRSSASAYVPPEVLRGEPAGERSGVYVLGALLYHFLAGAAPRRGKVHGHGHLDARAIVRLADWRPDLPETIDALVATAMADDPRRRPRSAGEVCEMAERTINGEGRPPQARGHTTPMDRQRGRRRQEPLPRLAPAGPRRRRSPANRLDPHDRFHYPPRVPGAPRSGRSLRAISLGLALLLGTGAGVLLGQSSDPESVRAKRVNAAGMELIVPPGWEATPTGDATALSVRAPGEPALALDLRLVDERIALRRRADSESVRLGRVQAWRDDAPGAVRYVSPTTAGKLLISCQATTADAGGLRLCERTASTLRLRTARALPLAGVIKEDNRLRAAVAGLREGREAARLRLARSSTPLEQRLAAEALARTHEHAARSLGPLEGAAPIAVAVHETAAAYRALAKAAGRSGARWSNARRQVLRREATLAEAVAARR